MAARGTALEAAPPRRGIAPIGGARGGAIRVSRNSRSLGRRLLPLTLAACASVGGSAAAAGPFQQFSVPGPAGTQGRYAAQLLSPGHYLVRFRGEAAVPRDRLQQYLLYGAAALTLQTGNDAFVLVHNKPRAVADGAKPASPTHKGPKLPDWRYYSPNACICACSCLVAWRAWSGPGPGRIGTAGQQPGPPPPRQVTAEILMYKGVIPAGGEGAQDARRVISDLGAAIAASKP